MEINVTKDTSKYSVNNDFCKFLLKSKFILSITPFHHQYNDEIGFFYTRILVTKILRSCVENSHYKLLLLVISFDHS